jgi:hypothetical protein
VAISVAHRRRLHDRAGGECSFPGCHEGQVLEEAHIVAREPGGPRADPSIPRRELDRYDNLILLCPTHHAVVDVEPEEWTVEKLRAMKTAHEDDVARRLAQTPESTIVPKVGEDSWLEPGAPTFRVNPGVDAATAETVKLLMTFAQTSGDEVVPDIEWSGANVEPRRPQMMPQNQPPGARFQKYQLKPVLARPALPNDEVSFDIRFRWHGATRQYRWAWPLYMREKGIWGMNNVAENTVEPKERTTLD